MRGSENARLLEPGDEELVDDRALARGQEAQNFVAKRVVLVGRNANKNAIQELVLASQEKVQSEPSTVVGVESPFRQHSSREPIGQLGIMAIRLNELKRLKADVANEEPGSTADEVGAPRHARNSEAREIE